MDALLTTSQVARITGRDRRTIRRWVTDDIVPGLGVEIGRQVFIRRSALEKLLGRRAQSGFTIRATEVPPE